MSEIPPTRSLRRSIILVVVALIYFASGKLGLRLAFVNASASAVWPPTGIALAALLVLGFRVWPAIFLGAFLVNLTTAGTILTSLGVALGNTLEGLAGAWLVSRYAGGKDAFDHSADVTKFAVLAAMCAPAISATIGVTTLAVGGFASWNEFGAIWRTWWLGDASGALVVAPLLVTWAAMPRLEWDRRRSMRVLGALFAVLVAGGTIFGEWVPFRQKGYPLLFLLLPMLVWIAFHFAQRETATAMFILSVVAVAGTLRGLGPFSLETQNESLLFLQVFLGIVVVMSMTLTAAVSERRASERRLDAQQEALEREKASAEAANRAKDEFLAALSHELRTPLTPVLLLAEAMERDGEVPEQFRKDAAMIRRNIELEARIIDDLLDLTRISHGKLALQFGKADAHVLLEHTVEILRGEIQAKEIDITLQLDAAAHKVSADAVRLEQVFWNILRNAVKFTPHAGRITLRSWNAGGQWHLAIADTGIGITAAELPRIFDAFAQGDEAATPRFGGLGLGLSISAALVREHLGRLWAESPGRGQGSTFHVELPVAVSTSTVTGHDAASHPPATRRFHILLVEDHESTRETLARLLTRHGHTIKCAEGVAQARAMARLDKFDIVVSDLGLPDGHGHDLMRELRRDFDLPGIALSGYGMESDIEKSKEAGFDEHLTKPVDLPKLESAMQQIVSAHTAAT